MIKYIEQSGGINPGMQQYCHVLHHVHVRCSACASFVLRCYQDNFAGLKRQVENHSTLVLAHQLSRPLRNSTTNLPRQKLRQSATF